MMVKGEVRMRTVFRDALRAEVSKFMTLRSAMLLIGASVVLPIVLSGVLTYAVVAALSSGHVNEVAGLDAASSLQMVLHYGQLGAVAVGALLVLEEQGHGVLRSSVLAVPQRSVLFAAKSCVAVSFGLGLSTVAVVGAYVIRGLMVSDVRIGGGGMSDVRILGGYVMYWTLLCLLTYFLGEVVNSGVVAMSVMVTEIVIVAPFLVSQTPLFRLLPDQAGMQMYADAPWAQGDLGPWNGLLVLLAWIGVFGVGANTVIRARPIHG